MLRTSFLKRTGIRELPEKNLKGLAEIMTAMAETVPFENLDVQLGKIVSIDIDAIADKILHRNRGGYCYEINGLLFHILKEWEMEACYLGARSIMGYESRRPVTHMLVKVNLQEGPYICDLGFTGLCPPEPLPLTDKADESKPYRFIAGQAGDWILQSKSPAGEWKSLYSFEDRPLEQVDFNLPNYFNNHSQESICTRKLICAIRKNGHSYRLVQNCLTVLDDGSSREQLLKTPEVFRRTLKEIFGLHLKEREYDALFNKAAAEYASL